MKNRKIQGTAFTIDKKEILLKESKQIKRLKAIEVTHIASTTSYEPNFKKIDSEMYSDNFSKAILVKKSKEEFKLDIMMIDYNNKTFLALGYWNDGILEI